MNLSIITICYNQTDIEETCESIVNQTFQDFEWIVIDGGSTNGALEKLKKYKNRINVLISEKDNGKYNAMNKGINLAKGKWLNFMNGGDSFSDNMVLEKIFKNKDYSEDIVYGYMNLVKKTGEKILHTYPETIDKRYLLNYCINHQASFIKKNFLTNLDYMKRNTKILQTGKNGFVLCQMDVNLN